MDRTDAAWKARVEALNLDAMKQLGAGQFANSLKLLRQAEALTLPAGYADAEAEANGGGMGRRANRERTAALLRASTLNNLGILYKQKGNLRQAWTFINRALRIEINERERAVRGLGGPGIDTDVDVAARYEQAKKKRAAKHDARIKRQTEKAERTAKRKAEREAKQKAKADAAAAAAAAAGGAAGDSKDKPTAAAATTADGKATDDKQPAAAAPATGDAAAAATKPADGADGAEADESEGESDGGDDGDDTDSEDDEPPVPSSIDEDGVMVCNPASTHLNMCAILSQLGRHTSALLHAECALSCLHSEMRLLEQRGMDFKNWQKKPTATAKPVAAPADGDGADAAPKEDVKDGGGEGDAAADADAGGEDKKTKPKADSGAAATAADASASGGGDERSEREKRHDARLEAMRESLLSLTAIAYHNAAVEQEYLHRYRASQLNYRHAQSVADRLLGVSHAISKQIDTAYRAAVMLHPREVFPVGEDVFDPKHAGPASALGASGAGGTGKAAVAAKKKAAADELKAADEAGGEKKTRKRRPAHKIALGSIHAKLASSFIKPLRIPKDQFQIVQVSTPVLRLPKTRPATAMPSPPQTARVSRTAQSSRGASTARAGMYPHTQAYQTEQYYQQQHAQAQAQAYAQQQHAQRYYSQSARGGGAAPNNYGAGAGYQFYPHPPPAANGAYPYPTLSFAQTNPYFPAGARPATNDGYYPPPPPPPPANSNPYYVPDYTNNQTSAPAAAPAAATAAAAPYDPYQHPYYSSAVASQQQQNDAYRNQYTADYNRYYSSGSGGGAATPLQPQPPPGPPQRSAARKSGSYPAGVNPQQSQPLRSTGDVSLASDG